MTTFAFTLDFREVADRLLSTQRKFFAKCTSYKEFRRLMSKMHVFRNHEKAWMWREGVRRFGGRLEELRGEDGLGEIKEMIWRLFGVIVEVSVVPLFDCIEL